MKRAIIWILLVICLCVFGFGGYRVYNTLRDNREGQQAYASLADSYVKVNPALSSRAEEQPGSTGSQMGGESSADAAAPAETPKPLPAPPIAVDFDQLLALNPDVVGWIYCEGTGINFPVAQGEDDNYYLRHFLDGTYNSHGTIFVDSENARGFTDRNTIIYGHNMSDGTMFAELEGYKTQAFYEEHPIFWLLTPEQNYQVRLFAGYVTDGTSKDAYHIFSEPCSELETYVQERIALSNFDAGLVPKKNDRLIMLSTCEYSFQTARYVLHGILCPCG